MISKKEVEHIAKLARLELAEKEIEKMQKDLSEILDYFNLLKEVKSEKSKITLGSKEKTTRPDLVISQSETEVKKLLDLVPDKKDSHVKVKAIL